MEDGVTECRACGRDAEHHCCLCGSTEAYRLHLVRHRDSRHRDSLAWACRRCDPDQRAWVGM